MHLTGEYSLQQFPARTIITNTILCNLMSVSGHFLLQKTIKMREKLDR